MAGDLTHRQKTLDERTIDSLRITRGAHMGSEYSDPTQAAPEMISENNLHEGSYRAGRRLSSMGTIVTPSCC